MGEVEAHQIAQFLVRDLQAKHGSPTEGQHRSRGHLLGFGSTDSGSQDWAAALGGGE